MCTEFTSCVLLFPLLILISIAASSFHLSLRDPGSLDFNMYRLLLLAFFFLGAHFLFSSAINILRPLISMIFFFKQKAIRSRKEGV